MESVAEEMEGGESGEKGREENERILGVGGRRRNRETDRQRQTNKEKDRERDMRERG